jgi:hypothetical protein
LEIDLAHERIELRRDLQEVRARKHQAHLGPRRFLDGSLNFHYFPHMQWGNNSLLLGPFHSNGFSKCYVSVFKLGNMKVQSFELWNTTVCMAR